MYSWGVVDLKVVVDQTMLVAREFSRAIFVVGVAIIAVVVGEAFAVQAAY